jgi:hypothetical protein
MTELCDLATKYGTDKGPAGHNYTPRYDAHFAPFRNESFNLLEIGVLEGASLRMWRDYFRNASVLGIDINPVPDDVQGRTWRGDVKNSPDFGQQFRVIVDDGSHRAADVVAAFDRLWPAVEPGGWYCIEDWDAIDEPFDNGGARLMIGHLVGQLFHERGQVAEVHCYDQVVMLRKRD